MNLTSLILKTYPSLFVEPVFVFCAILETQKLIKSHLSDFSGIYGIWNLENKQIYIGSAKDLSKLPFQHLYKSSSTNKHLYNAIQKYSLNNFLLCFGISVL